MGPSEPTGLRAAQAPVSGAFRAAGRTLVGAALAGVFVLVASHRSDATLAPPTAQTTAAVSNGFIPAPGRQPALTAAPGDKALPRLGAETERPSGEARDLYGFGEFSKDGPVLRLEARWNLRSPAAHSLFVDAAEAAARADAAVVKLGRSTLSQSERGLVEAAPAVIAVGAAQRECVAFRLGGAGAVRITGIACPETGAPASEADAACLIGRVAVSPFGASVGVADLLRGPPAKRSACRSALG